VSTSGGMEPVWSRDGREIFYRSGAGGGAKLLAVSVTLTPAFAITARRELFLVSDMASATPHRNYDVSPDGKSFAFVRFNPSTRVVIIQNLPALVASLRSENGTP
jgi:Tol biopolymer transport system component